MRAAASKEAIDRGLVSSLSSLEQAINYRDWLLELSQPFLESPVLEVGAGKGTFTLKLVELGAVTAIEPSQSMAGLLTAASASDPRVTVVVGEIHDVPSLPQFASAVMYNVLEHIEDDRDALLEVKARLLPGGHLVLWVPAFQFLFSDYDHSVGHHRRYRHRELTDLVRSCDFQVVRSHYANIPGFFTWLVACRWLGWTPENGWAPRFFDRIAVPAVRLVERHLRPPFGQSILLVARKPLNVC